MTKFIKLQTFNSAIEEELKRTPKCVINLYILEDSNLSSRDIDSNSDPYLKIIARYEVFDEKKD